MTDDLNRLRAVAQAATPGEWHVTEFNGEWEVSYIAPDDDPDFPGEPVAIATGLWPEANATHIATFDPPTVLALLDRAERAETERDAAELQNQHERRTAESARDDLAALRAAVTALADEIEAASPEPFAPFHFFYGQKLRSLLAAAPTETEGTPDD